MTSTTTMKPIMMNHTTSDALDDPFADLPTVASEDASFSTPPPQLVSPLEFGTGIKYLQEQHDEQQEQNNTVAIEKDTDVTETTVVDDAELSEDMIEEAPVTSVE